MSNWFENRENIQPNRRGRSANFIRNLGAPMEQRKTTHEDWRKLIAQQPHTFPVHVQYLKWIEDNYANLGSSQSGYIPALFTIMKTFHNLLSNDQRYVSIWLKYVDFHHNQQEVFELMRKRNIGQKDARFYIRFSKSYEDQGKYREADSLLRQGTSVNAQPIGDLRQYNLDFQRRMLENDFSNRRVPTTPIQRLKKKVYPRSPLSPVNGNRSSKKQKQRNRYTRTGYSCGVRSGENERGQASRSLFNDRSSDDRMVDEDVDTWNPNGGVF